LSKWFAFNKIVKHLNLILFRYIQVTSMFKDRPLQLWYRFYKNMYSQDLS